MIKHFHVVAEMPYAHSILCYVPNIHLFYATADEADAYMFYRCFFCFLFIFVFFFASSVRHKNTRQPFSGTAELIFIKLLPNDSGENGVSNVMPPPGEWLKISLCCFGIVRYRENGVSNVVPLPGQ